MAKEKTVFIGIRFPWARKEPYTRESTENTIPTQIRPKRSGTGGYRLGGFSNRGALQFRM